MYYGKFINAKIKLKFNLKFKTPSWKDPLSCGYVYSMYSLTQVRRPALTQWAIIHHANESLWSSLGPKYELGNPQEIVQNFLDSQVGLNPCYYEIIEDLPVYTRAIHYQQLPIVN